MQVNTISEQLFFTTVKIDAVGSGGEQVTGTGFFINHMVDGAHHMFIVTNKHVINGTSIGVINLLQGYKDQHVLTGSFTMPIPEYAWLPRWYGHPDDNVDIAIYPFYPLLDFANFSGFEPFLRCIDTSMIPDSQQIAELDAIEPVVFVGYPNGLWDKKNFLPIVRRGTTATPLQVDFEGSPKFLIDASVFGGSSGSPVFIHNQRGWSNKNGVVSDEPRFLFVGVIAEVFARTYANEIKAIPIPTGERLVAVSTETIDLGVAFKARVVLETIESWLKMQA